MGLSQWPEKFRDHDTSADREDTKRLVWAEVNRPVSHITEKAMGLDLKDAPLWLPLSQIEQATIQEGTNTGDFDVDDVEVEDFVTHVQIPLWLAEAKDLEWEE